MVTWIERQLLNGYGEQEQKYEDRKRRMTFFLRVKSVEKLKGKKTAKINVGRCGDIADASS
jgi:hypothetical protein